ncbi:MAG: hypothetical protein VKJ02_13725 [Snowella sp.]|nr:hypothetical protein [Snowella sp.]
MRLQPAPLFFSFSLFTFVSLLASISLPAIAAEETIVVCQGGTRNTARIYQENGTLKMRLYDRKDKVTWFNSDAQRKTTSNAIAYTNIRGEGTYQVKISPNAKQKDCSIQISGKPLEKGTVTERSKADSLKK